MVGYDDRRYVMMMKLVVNLVVLIHSSCFYNTHSSHHHLHTGYHTHSTISVYIFTFIFFAVSDMIIIWMIYYIYILDQSYGWE